MDMVTCGEENVEADQNEEEEAEEGHMYRVNENLGDAKSAASLWDTLSDKSHFLTCQVGIIIVIVIIIIIIIIIIFFSPYFQPLAKNLSTCIPFVQGKSEILRSPKASVPLA